jgi:hypothetical protein
MNVEDNPGFFEIMKESNVLFAFLGVVGFRFVPSLPAVT